MNVLLSSIKHLRIKYPIIFLGCELHVNLRDVGYGLHVSRELKQLSLENFECRIMTFTFIPSLRKSFDMHRKNEYSLLEM